MISNYPQSVVVTGDTHVGFVLQEEDGGPGTRSLFVMYGLSRNFLLRRRESDQPPYDCLQTYSFSSPTPTEKSVVFDVNPRPVPFTSEEVGARVTAPPKVRGQGRLVKVNLDG